MKRFEGTRTEENLRAAFAGELQATNQYSFYSNRARKDGYEQIAEIFDITAGNEKQHAELWYKLLNDGIISDTKQNLKNAVSGEDSEWMNIYPKFAKEAREDGFNEVATFFEEVAGIEAEHAKRFAKLLSNIENGLVFTKNEDAIWVCRNCGYVHIGKRAPEFCPFCGYPQAYFELQADNY